MQQELKKFHCPHFSKHKEFNIKSVRGELMPAVTLKLGSFFFTLHGRPWSINHCHQQLYLCFMDAFSSHIFFLSRHFSMKPNLQRIHGRHVTVGCLFIVIWSWQEKWELGLSLFGLGTWQKDRIWCFSFTYMMYVDQAFNRKSCRVAMQPYYENSNGNNV